MIIQNQTFSKSQNKEHAIYGAVIQARDVGMKNPLYSIEDDAVTAIGFHTRKPWYYKYYSNPYIDKVTITSYEGVVITMGECILAIKGYSLFEDTVDYNHIKTRYVVKLLSKQLEGMKLIHSNIKANELEHVINEYYAIQSLENDVKNLNDKKNYEVVEFEDEFQTRYYLASKNHLQDTVQEFYDEQAREG